MTEILSLDIPVFSAIFFVISCAVCRRIRPFPAGNSEIVIFTPLIRRSASSHSTGAIFLFLIQFSEKAKQFSSIKEYSSSKYAGKTEIFSFFQAVTVTSRTACTSLSFHAPKNSIRTIISIPPHHSNMAQTPCHPVTALPIVNVFSSQSKFLYYYTLDKTTFLNRNRFQYNKKQDTQVCIL